MVDFWSKCPIRKLWQIFKSFFVPNFTFFRGPQVFLLFYSLLLIYSIGKEFKMEKSPWAVFSVAGPARHWPRPNPACKAGPRRLLPWHATRQPLYFTDGNRYAPDPLRCPVPSQTWWWNPTMPRAKALHLSVCELPITSLCLPPRLRTAGKPHCRWGIVSPCCVSRLLSWPLNSRDAGAKHPVTMPCAVPLLPPSLLTPRAARLASESQAYGVLVRFFPCKVYIDSSHHDTLGYEWQFVITVIS
jgi:hypothetical protein